jgi:mono/diheme cytochrome c family protein
MKARFLCVLCSVVMGLAIAVPSRAASDSNLTADETNGKKMFLQRCSICHTQVQSGGKPYGPWLTANSVANEAAARAIITKGTQRMPGFQYGLEPREIDNIIAYLKTVKKAPQPGAKENTRPNDPGRQD